MIAGRWHLKCQTDTYSPTEGSRIEDDILPDFRAPKSHILLNKTAANCLPGRDTAITKPHRTTSVLHVSIAKYWSKSLACHSTMCIGFSSGRCSDGSNRFCSVSLTSPVRAELIVTHDCSIETYMSMMFLADMSECLYYLPLGLLPIEWKLCPTIYKYYQHPLQQVLVMTNSTSQPLQLRGSLPNIHPWWYFKSYFRSSTTCICWLLTVRIVVIFVQFFLGLCRHSTAQVAKAFLLDMVTTPENPFWTQGSTRGYCRLLAIEETLWGEWTLPLWTLARDKPPCRWWNGWSRSWWCWRFSETSTGHLRLRVPLAIHLLAFGHDFSQQSPRNRVLDKLLCHCVPVASDSSIFHCYVCRPPTSMLFG